MHPRQRTYFTLIELLVVVAIISILASMLLPALSRARESARGAKCLNNLKQVMMGNHMYTDDADGFLVPAIGRASGNVYYNSKAYWFYKLTTEGGYVEAGSLLCPSDTLQSDWANNFGEMGGAGDQLPISFGYSGSLGNAYHEAIYAAATSALTRPRRVGDFNGQKLAKSAPESAFVLFDYSSLRNAAAPAANTAVNNKVDGNSSFAVSRISARHGGGADVHGNFWPSVGAGNFAFVDGHVATLRAPFALSYFSMHSGFRSKYDFAGGW